MAALRYYYSDSITTFLSRSNNEIVGALTLASRHGVKGITGRFFDPLKMAESITDLRTHESTKTRK